VLSQVVGGILGGIAFAAGAYMLFLQFADPRGAQNFAIGMKIALLIGGAVAVITSLRPRR
jgi:hypothetical protein